MKFLYSLLNQATVNSTIALTTSPSRYRRIRFTAVAVLVIPVLIIFPGLCRALLPPADVECCQRKEYQSDRCTKFALTDAKCEKVFAGWADLYRKFNAPRVPAADDAPALRLGRVMNEARQSGFSGVVLVGDDARVLFEKSIGVADRQTRLAHSADMPWRWASVSKQVTAVITAQLIEEGKLFLDSVVADYLKPADFPGRNAGLITIRHLLQHTSGLPNPSDGEMPGDIVPAFYRARVATETVHANAARGLCAGTSKRAPGESFEYNNCDYLVLARVIEVVTGQRFAEVLATRITKPLVLASVLLAADGPSDTLTVKGYTDATHTEAAFNLATYGAAGAMVGSPRDLLALDRALMGNALLSAASKKQFWTGVPALGYAALGAWSFPASIKGCGERVDLIERRGEIGGIQVRNIIAPKLLKAVVIFTNRADWEFGEIWQGKGFSHDVLSAALCP